ncbi:zinc finger protein 596-like [Pollicipes pollicipes]|uniref:zinc finger protein 596-like n=1 Tax=Pollicipes pollicipes TaxID=41117 RepID=UPI0018851597|nr:zinc finger protein 596-like [Pollicipes pollicipes]
MAYTCPVCRRVYTHPESLRQHLPVHSGDTTCRLCGRTFCRPALLRCPVCGKTYTHPKSLSQHLPVHSGETTCQLCGVIYCRRSLYPALTCLVCGRGYTSLSSLRKHWRSHSDATTCRLCGVGLSRVAHLHRHLRNVHHLTREQALFLRHTSAAGWAS